jgi:hypothetical protein
VVACKRLLTWLVFVAGQLFFFFFFFFFFFLCLRVWGENAVEVHSFCLLLVLSRDFHSIQGNCSMLCCIAVLLLYLVADVCGSVEDDVADCTTAISCERAVRSGLIGPGKKRKKLISSYVSFAMGLLVMNRLHKLNCWLFVIKWFYFVFALWFYFVSLFRRGVDQCQPDGSR